jgi:D-sedoheptulose 7-phosphate isomerase
VIKAIEAARAQGMKVITLTGKDGGKMAVPPMLKFACRILVMPTVFRKFTLK